MHDDYFCNYAFRNETVLKGQTTLEYNKTQTSHCAHWAVSTPGFYLTLSVLKLEIQMRESETALSEIWFR